MKHVFLLISLFTVAGLMTAQEDPYKKKTIAATDLEVFYSFYNQDGNNSAVTGGIGTEKLHINNVGVNPGVTIDTSHTIILQYLSEIVNYILAENEGEFTPGCSASRVCLRVPLLGGMQGQRFVLITGVVGQVGQETPRWRPPPH